MVAAYRSQSEVEAKFRQMKDPHVVSFSPMHHWTDHKIRVHVFYCVVFYCVLALAIAHLMRREAEHASLHLSVRALLDELAGIGETVLLYHDSGKAALPAHAHRHDPNPGVGGAVVPYIGTWTGEQRCALQLGWRGNRLGYADEIPIDRDEWGVLWQRHTARIGVGRPLFTVVHPLRQRRVMTRLLCQVCARAADHTEAGTLWLLPAREVATFDDRDGLVTNHPPLCVPCARVSVRRCPGMRPDHVAVRARSAVCGVLGTVFRPLNHAPWMERDDERTADTVRFDDPAIAWTQATQLARVLVNISVVDLDTLATGAGPVGVSGRSGACPSGTGGCPPLRPPP